MTPTSLDFTSNSNSTCYYNAAGQPMTGAAFHAIIAARHWQQWGAWAALRYAQRNGSSLRLVTLARQLIAASSASIAA